MNTAMLLEMAAQGFGERVAIVSGADRVSYAELYQAAGAAAERVLQSGAKHVGVLDTSSLAVPIALFASARAGLPFVPLNYRLTGGELDRLIERVLPLFLVTDPERATLLGARPGTHALPRDAFVAAARGAERGVEGYPMEAEAIAVLLFTSGTTGAPKAAVLRHKHLASYILGSVEFGGADEREATLVSVPPYHVAGIAAVLSSVYAGRRIVQLPSFEAARWIELARTEHVSHAFVVPTMLQRIVGELQGRRSADLPELRAISYGGGKMPQAVIERAMEFFPEVAFTNAYGLTETSSTICLLGPEDHRAAVSSPEESVRRRITSVGRPLPGLELEIRDEEGRPVPPGTRGEIWVRGEQVSGEYLGRDPIRLDDGWFPTRDGGYLDDAGYLFLDGRIDDIIVRGGENLSPGEIEDCLLEHEAVEDCAVVGVPDEQWGEAVAAAIVLKPGQRTSAEQLRDWVRRHLRSSRAPDRIEFRAELPYNETGKLLRRVVRSELSGSES